MDNTNRYKYKWPMDHKMPLNLTSCGMKALSTEGIVEGPLQMGR